MSQTRRDFLKTLFVGGAGFALGSGTLLTERTVAIPFAEGELIARTAIGWVGSHPPPSVRKIDSMLDEVARRWLADMGIERHDVRCEYQSSDDTDWGNKVQRCVSIHARRPMKVYIPDLESGKYDSFVASYADALSPDDLEYLKSQRPQLADAIAGHWEKVYA